MEHMLEAEWESEIPYNNNFRKTAILTAAGSVKGYSTSACWLLHTCNSKWGLWNTCVMTVYYLAVKVSRKAKFHYFDMISETDLKQKHYSRNTKFVTDSFQSHPPILQLFSINYCKTDPRQLNPKSPTWMIWAEKRKVTEMQLTVIACPCKLVKWKLNR